MSNREFEEWVNHVLKSDVEISDEDAIKFLKKKAALAKEKSEKEGALAYLEKHFNVKRKAIDTGFVKNVLSSTLARSTKEKNIDYDKRYRSHNDNYRRDFHKERGDYYRDRYYDRDHDYRHHRKGVYEIDFPRDRGESGNYRCSRDHDEYYRTRERYFNDRNETRSSNIDNYRIKDEIEHRNSSKHEKDTKKSFNTVECTTFSKEPSLESSIADVNNLFTENTTNEDSTENLGTLTNIEVTQLEPIPPQKRLKRGRGSVGSRILDVLFHDDDREQGEITKTELKLLKREKKRLKKEKKRLKKEQKLKAKLTEAETSNE